MEVFALSRARRRALNDDTAVLPRGGEGEETTGDMNISHNGMHADTLHALSNIAIG